MTYDLLLGDYAYSSWSMRAGLLFDHFDIAHRLTLIDFAKGDVAAQMPHMTPARTVPAMRTPEGAILSDSLALAEELASRHPGSGLWPADPRMRATARNLAAEMHAGFTSLRADCPMNLRVCYTGVIPSEAVTADLRRLEVIWDHARASCAPDGPWLCGDYSIADAFFAPVAARITGYGLRVSDSARAYVAEHLADPAFRRWRALGLKHGATLERYRKPFATTDWPDTAPARST